VPAPITSTDRIDDDWPLTVTPASVRPQPSPRAVISATTTANIGKNQNVGLR
jgi:hypothetical protein